MKMIKPSVELIKETNPFKKIERAGRTCYKSEKNITEDSCYNFFGGLVRRNHYAMLEHATFVFEVTGLTYEKILKSPNIKYLNLTATKTGSAYRYLVSGNLRAINECRLSFLLDALMREDPRLVYLAIATKLDCGGAMVVNLSDYSDLSLEEFLTHSFLTYRIVTDRGVTHELVRHRPASFAQESTRYCNYSKNDDGLTFIEPSTWDSWTDQQQMIFISQMKAAEQSYLALTINEGNKGGLSTEQSRAVLPNAIKTEIIVTMNGKELDHFFNLRLFGVTGPPHPDMKVIAEKMHVLYEESMIYTIETSD